MGFYLDIYIYISSPMLHVRDDVKALLVLRVALSRTTFVLMLNTSSGYAYLHVTG